MRTNYLRKLIEVPAVPLAGLFVIAVLGLLSMVAVEAGVGAQSTETVRLNTLSHGGFYAPLSVSDWTKWAQPFCTGSQDVTLKKLRLWTQAVSVPSDGMPTVSIHANQLTQSMGFEGAIFDGAEPGHRVGTLTTPTLDGNINTAEDFTSSGGIFLRAYSRYWVVLERPSNAGTFRLALANRDGHSSVDDGGESGWELSGTWWRTQTYYYGVRRIPMDAWYYDGFYHDWSLSMGLYTTPDEKANSPPVLLARECGRGRDPDTEISVDENTPGGTVFANVRGYDGDGDTLTYTLTGRDRRKFDRLFSFNTSNGDISVKRGVRVNFEETDSGHAAPLAFHTYNLNVSVTDGKDDTGAVESDPTIDDSRSITIRVNNVDEAGRVKFEEFSGNRATEITTPTVGTEFKATAVDPDGVLRSVLFVARRFEFGDVPVLLVDGTQATDPQTNELLFETGMVNVVALGSLTEGRYTPVTADVGKYIGVEVLYIDKECPYIYTLRDIDGDDLVDEFSRFGDGRLLRAFGDCTKSAFSYMANTTVAASSEQQESGTQQRSSNGGRSVSNDPTFTNTRKSVNVRVNENSGGQTPVTGFEATDPNNDPLSFFVGGTDVNAFANAFDFDTNNGDIEVKSDDSLDYETKQRYSITVSVTDGKDSSGNAEDPPTMDDSVDVEINVVNVNDPGVVTLSSNPPVIGHRVTATLTDDDGIFTSSNNPVVWRWLRSGAGDSDTFTEISGATSNRYRPVQADLGRRLKARATYSDRLAQGRVATSEESYPVANPNQPAAGVPTINGTAEIGATLTAVTTGITDADGLENVTFAYQWLADDVEIANATGSSYTVVTDDLDKTIKVRVSFTDDAYHSEALTSAATASVTPQTSTARQNSAAAGSPTISGTAQVGERLTASTTGITDADGLENVTFAHQWLADDVEITNATGSSYLVTASELGKTIKVRVSFTDDASNSEVLTSAATGTVLARANRAASGSPSINGTAHVGETLAAVTSAITDADGLSGVSYSYQWLADDVEIANATGSSYTIAVSDVGKRIKVRVSFTDDASNPEESTSGATATVPAAFTASILNAPTAHDGTNFKFELRFSEKPKRYFSYRTLRDHAFTVNGGDVHYVRRLERGKNMRWEITISPSSDGAVTISLPATTSCTATGAICTDDGRKLQAVSPTEIPGPPPQNTPAAGGPTISGPARVNETLTAVTSGITDADGLTGVSYSYQWLADDVEIANATGSSYTLTTSELNKAIKVRVSFSDDASNAEVLTSTATAAVSAPANSPAAGVPTINGTPRVGETLTAVTTGITDADGLDNVSYTYEWFAGSSQISGASASTYVLTDAEKGSPITVRVSFNDDSGNPEAQTSAATSAVEGPALTATIHNAPSSHGGSDFTFELRFSEHFALSYKTLRDTAFTVTGAEVVNATRKVPGKNVRWAMLVSPSSNGTVTIELPATTDCEATGAICTGDGRKLSTALSIEVPGSTVQTQVTQNSAAAGGPSISGTAQVGETLTAVTSGITDADGLTGVSYSYQWLADDVEIANATGSSYTVTDSELNKAIKVRVSFTDDASNAEVLTSVATGAVSARANRPAAGAPTISGTARVGETLTAVTSNITDADGLTNVAYTYEWFAGAAQISGASSSTYILTDAEKGSLIKVRVSFTDDSGNPEALTSAATSEVAGPLLTAMIHAAPSSHDGSEFTFELRFSEHFTLSYRTLWDHAFTVSGGEVSHVRRLERGKNIRWEITVTPSSNGTVTIELPATTDCSVTSALCAGDGRKLTSALSTVIPGPNP